MAGLLSESQLRSSNSVSSKKLLIGLDEAGYGPNLGPLVIGGTAWLVPSEMSEAEFAAAFTENFSPVPWSSDCQLIPLGDSKKLYHSGTGLLSLEAGLLAMLRMLKHSPVNLQDLLRLLTFERTEGDDASDSNLPWYHNLHHFRIPTCEPARVDEILALVEQARTRLASHQIELVAITATFVTESEFNRRVHHTGSKGLLLADATLELARQLLQKLPNKTAEIFCDRQGGRKNYLPILLRCLPDTWFIETRQSGSRSSYRSSCEPTLEIHFTVEGDAFPATALASMAAKYVRERMMESLNRFWALHSDGLTRTAGYPVDARRFRDDIRPIADRLSLAEQLWWRCR